jgi:hypothetical protein
VDAEQPVIDCHDQNLAPALAKPHRASLSEADSQATGVPNLLQSGPDTTEHIPSHCL